MFGYVPFAFRMVITSLSVLIPHPAAAQNVTLADVPIVALSTSTLLYVSDYFSFSGQDSQGHVAFALDNNRGRDGDAYQAEHFLVLHDERQGWVRLAGNGRYDNTRKELKAIPDSPFFRFQGSPPAGMTITSETNQITLRTEPIPERTRNIHNGAATWMGSAPAVLTWKNRTIPGHVIYEYVLMPDFNRLTRTYWGMWKEFQGLYLVADTTGDVYVHSQLSERIAPLVGMLAGFTAFDGRTESMKDLKVDTLERQLAFGFYRWPTAWRISWTGPKGPATLTLLLSDRNGVANWIIGGFSMGIVRGELDYARKNYQIYGLAELII